MESLLLLSLIIVTMRVIKLFLCKLKSFGDKNLTKEEMDDFHLSTLRLSYEEACKEYEYRANTKLGKLISNRELPILHRAKKILDKM